MKNYLRYIYAILAVPLAILLRFALVPFIGYGIPYIILFPITVGVALLAGKVPAVMTGFFGAIITDYFFAPPLHTVYLDVSHITRLSIIVLTSVFVGCLGDELRAGREKAEKQTLALRENEQRLKKSEEIAHLGSWELDIINNHLSWSDEVYRIFGLKPQEFGATYEVFLDAVHPEDRSAVNKAYSSSLGGGKDIYEIEHRVVRKSTGEIRYVHEKCEHIRDESGKIIRSVGMVHDITERRQAEEEVLRAKEEWERTFDSVPDLMAIIDNHHRIVRVNKAMAQRLGIDADECVGLPCYRYVHGQDRPPEFCPHSVTLKDGCYHTAELHEERLGGDFLVTTNPLFDKQGQLTGSVHVARDITERKRAEEEIKSLNYELECYVLELEAANKELEAFSYSVSHDLRAPLRSIAGFSQVLLEDYEGGLDAEGKDSLDRIISATQRMGQLIDDMLNLSRVTRAELKRERISLSGIAEKITESLKKTEPERQVKFIVAGDIFVYGDENLLTLMFDNLMGNAWKFTAKNPMPVIEFGMRDKGISPIGLIGPIYYVKDNGAGFDMAYADKLFRPFQRLHKLEEFPGTGIGLATVKRIINRHSGRVWIEGEVDKGATVYFTL